jgi:hypothetical protein
MSPSLVDNAQEAFYSNVDCGSLDSSEMSVTTYKPARRHNPEDYNTNNILLVHLISWDTRSAS